MVGRVIRLAGESELHAESTDSTVAPKHTAMALPGRAKRELICMSS
jgi:hypothetical protein